MKDSLKISETQEQLMDFFWSNPEKISSREIQRIFKGKNWKIQTVHTHLTRLADKNLIAFERAGRAYMYFPTMTKEEYKLARTIHMINFHYNSVKDFVKILVNKNYVDKNDVLQLIEDYF